MRVFWLLVGLLVGVSGAASFFVAALGGSIFGMACGFLFLTAGALIAKRALSSKIRVRVR